METQRQRDSLALTRADQDYLVARAFRRHKIFPSGKSFISHHKIKRNICLNVGFLSLSGGNREQQSQSKKTRAQSIHKTSSKNGEEKAGPDNLADGLLLSSF
jgi:hypothetical protein